MIIHSGRCDYDSWCMLCVFLINWHIYKCQEVKKKNSQHSNSELANAGISLNKLLSKHLCKTVEKY